MTPDIKTKTISSTAAAIAATVGGGSAGTPIPPPPPPLPLTLPLLPQMQPQISQSTTSLTSARLARRTKLSSSSSLLTSSTSALALSKSSSTMRRHLLTIEKLRNRVHQILKCVINLHIDILVIESNVNQLLDDVKEFNADLMEVQRLDNLIETLRDYNGPTICHEWPFPLVCQGAIEEADLAQTLNTNDIFTTA